MINNEEWVKLIRDDKKKTKWDTGFGGGPVERLRKEINMEWAQNKANATEQKEYVNVMEILREEREEQLEKDKIQMEREKIQMEKREEKLARQRERDSERTLREADRKVRENERELVRTKREEFKRQKRAIEQQRRDKQNREDIRIKNIIIREKQENDTYDPEKTITDREIYRKKWEIERDPSILYCPQCYNKSCNTYGEGFHACAICGWRGNAQSSQERIIKQLNKR